MITLGDLARDEFLAFILDPTDPHYGWIDKARIWPQPIDGEQGEQGEQGEPGEQGPPGVTGLASRTAQLSLSNSTAQTVIISATLPAGLMAAGTTFRLRAWGAISSAAIAPGTATWCVRVGPISLTGNIAASIALAALTASMSAKAWFCQADVTVRVAGASGNVLGLGALTGNLGPAAGFLYSPAAALPAVAVDTTIQNLIQLTFQFGTADPANTLTVDVATIELVKS